jgi:predicted aldo/keto reductase-like oxidoreductase
MSEMKHVEENLVSAANSAVGSLSADELDLVDRVRDAYRSLSPIPCTDCKYCMPCPSGVAIPRLFSLYNGSKMYGNEEGAKRSYNEYTNPENRADQCVECGQCEQACPQQIEIIDWLKNVHAVLAASPTS